MAEAKYIYLTVKDVDANIEKEYENWMMTEHIPDLLGVPGVIRGLRYVSHDGSSPKHMMVYEMESAGVPESEAWAKAAHTERASAMSKRWDGKARNVFELVAVLDAKSKRK